jgi:hypothetical protein
VRMMSVRPTGGKGCGYWPTVTVNDSRGSAYQYSRGDHDKIVLNLTGAVKMWPSPTCLDTVDRKGMRPSRAATNRKTGYLSEAIRQWPTPQNSDHIQKRTSKNWKEQGAVNYCLSNPEITGVTNGQLNPSWVSWLQGWPIGWTSLEPLTDLTWLSWEVDPADGERPESVTDGRGYMTPKSGQCGMTAKTSGRPIEMATHLTTQTHCLGPGTGPIPRVAVGVKDRVNRLKALGNGQVPQCAAEAFRMLWGAMHG